MTQRELYKLEIATAKKKFSIEDIICYVDASISHIIEDSTTYWLKTTFSIDFVGCGVDIEAEINWIFNQETEMVDFVRLSIFNATREFKNGSTESLTSEQIQLIERAVNIG